MRNIVLTYGVMCETINHMHFADDGQVNLACRELALQCLLPVGQMRILIRYLYYENLLAYGVWQADEGDAALRRQSTVQALTRLLSRAARGCCRSSATTSCWTRTRRPSRPRRPTTRSTRR